jgi:hypothetical protein
LLDENSWSIQVNDGLLLEDIGVKVPWGTPIAELQNFGDPEVLPRETSISYVWRNRRVLGGLLGDVSACRLFDKPNPRAYHIYLPELYHFSIDLAPRPGNDKVALAAQLLAVHDHFELQLGPATFSYPDYSLGLPAIFWERPPLGFSCAVMGKEVVTATVQRTPDGYAQLRDEAGRISRVAGKGARVDFVAWDPSDPRIPFRAQAED